MNAIGRVVLIGWLCIAGIACTPVNYQKPISEFAVATAEAETAFLALDEQITDAYAEKIRADALARKGIVKAQSGECNLTSERCRLELVTSDGAEPFDPDPILGNISALMRLTTAYAKSLAEIVNADTAAQVTTQVNRALGSVENLAATVDGIKDTEFTKSVTAYKAPGAKLASWIAGQYVAAVQVEGLRKATATADPVIREAAGIFEEAAEIARPFFNAQPQKEFETALQKLEKDEQRTGSAALESNVDALVAKAKAYDRVLLAKPSSVYARLSEAHAALTSDLAGDDVSLATAAARIEAFATEVKTLVSIIHELKAAGKQNE